MNKCNIFKRVIAMLIVATLIVQGNYELDVDIDKTQDLNIDVYENGELIETLDDDITYEGQCTLVAAGSATYWLFSAAVSAVITYKAYNIVTSSSKSNNNAKSRQPGQPIDKSKAPGPRKNNKNVKKKNDSLPIKGEPNSSTSNYSENGKLLQRRFYDENGEVCLDVDYSHGGNHTFPHIHIWK